MTCSPDTRSKARLVTSRVSPGSGAHEINKCCPDCQEVLDIVQDQQRRPGLQVSAYGFPGRLVRCLQAERADDRHPQQSGVANGGQRNECQSVEVGIQFRRYLHSKPGLADPTGAGQRHQPHTGANQQCPQAGDLTLASDQRRQRHRLQPHPRGRR